MSAEDKENKEIQSWGNRAMDHARNTIEQEELAKNERNRRWWEELPMTYDDWNSECRDPTSREDFVRVDQFYFKTNPYIEESIDFQSFSGLEVLEIGCGAGSASCRFAAHGAKVTAVDITAKAVELTTRHAEVLGITNLQALQLDAENLVSLQDGYFDYLYSWGVMHHSSDPERCFAQAFAKLKPGGRGLIMVYHNNSIRYRIKGLYWLICRGKLLRGDTYATVQRHYTDGYFHKHYSRSSLKKSLVDAGFEVERIDITHMGSRMIPIIPDSLRNWLKLKFGWLLVAKVIRHQ